MRRQPPAAAPAAPIAIVAPAAGAPPNAPATRPRAGAGDDLPAAGAPASAPTAPTAIIAPLAAELAGVLAATRARRTLRVRVEAPRGRRPWLGLGPWRRWRWSSRWTVTLGRLAGEEVALMATGDGPAAAAAGLQALLAAVQPRRLLVIGVAGGLTPGLVEGTLVAARQVVAGDGAMVPREPDAAWLAAALAGGAVAGAVVSADRILADPAARQAVLGRALPAAAAVVMPGTVPSAIPATIATVDLESVAYAHVAAARSLPYLVVRAVLDPAEERLPLDFEACRDGSGRVSNARVLWHALARPRSLGKLWRLRTRVRDAAAGLATLAERLVAAPANGVPARAGAVLQGCQPGGALDMGGARDARGAREPGDAGDAATVDMRREIPAAAAGRRTA
jgi:adenosylhomocysteine nucleosidase